MASEGFRSFTHLPHSFTGTDTSPDPGGLNSPTTVPTDPGGVNSPTDTDSTLQYGTSNTFPNTSGTASDTDSASTPPPTPTPSTTPTPMSTTTTSSMGSPSATAIGALSGRHHTSGGAIAGGVIGALAALGLLALLALALRNRKRRSSPRASPLESGHSLYTEPKPRSRPASRIASTHTPHAGSVGTIESFGAARTWESGGTLAGVQDDEDAYLEKLEAAEGPIVPVLTPAAPAPVRTNSTARARRTVSQDYSARVPVPAYPPAAPAMAPSTSNPDLKGGAPRRVPRKKPVPRYSGELEGASSAESASPPAPGSPFADAAQPFHDGRPVHYLMPDLPPPQL